MYKAERDINSNDRISLRFNKFNHSHIAQARSTSTAPANAEDGVGGEEGAQVDLYQQLISPFSKIGGEDSEGTTGKMSYSGVFLAGPRPCFVLVGLTSQDPISQFDAVESDDAEFGLNLLEAPLMKRGKNHPWVHPFMRDSSVVSFAEFHNEVSPRGFLYLNSLVFVSFIL